MSAQEITQFWLHETAPEQWYSSSDTLDQEITKRFYSLWQEAEAGGLKSWVAHPDTVLAYIILCDQFPRNMFRGSPMAFATDAKARMAAKSAIAKGWDMRVSEEAHRQFFYLPLMHSENQCDQNRCVRLMVERLPQVAYAQGHLDHARAHREIIRKFGRFPYRNSALGRVPTGAEAEFMAQNGYEATLEGLRA